MIITVQSPQNAVLRQQAEEISADEKSNAQKIANQLISSLTPFFPAAGLAAPQIGISKAVFIYSYDRKPEHLEVVINPQMHGVGDKMIEGWEGCFSTVCEGHWKLALVRRFETIEVSFLNLKGERVEKRLDGFAAKVFQHEYDHLQGVLALDRKEAVIKEFPTKEALEAFLAEVKKGDALRYNSPNETQT